MHNTKPFVHIKPRSGWNLFDSVELLHYRDLLYFLTMRSIKVKYKQTVLGGLWAVIQPLFSVAIFTLVFGKLARIPSDGVPYPVFSLTAMVAWIYFANSVSSAANSIVQEAGLLTKVYFPRLFIPLAYVLAGLLDFIIAYLISLILALCYGITLRGTLLLMPVFVLLMALSATGAGVFLAAMNARYRDVRYAIPFLVQLWMFASPIVYPSSIFPEYYRLAYALNPMAGIIEGFRYSLIGGSAFPFGMIAVSAASGVVLFCVGLIYFKKTERFFADIV